MCDILHTYKSSKSGLKSIELSYILWANLRFETETSYGTTATNVAMPDEHTDIEEWIAVIKTQLASIYDYLTDDVVYATNA